MLAGSFARLSYCRFVTYRNVTADMPLRRSRCAVTSGADVKARQV